MLENFFNVVSKLQLSRSQINEVPFTNVYLVS